MTPSNLDRYQALAAQIGRAMAEPVHIRPPMEAQSVLIRATRGCVWNQCRHCSLYRETTHSTRPVRDVCDDITLAHALYGNAATRMFLGDADLLALPPADATEIVRFARATFPALQRISAYAIPDSGLKWTPRDLASVRDAGLTRIYTGSDTGSPTLQQLLNRPADPDGDREGMIRMKAAGFALWMKVALGLGGSVYSAQHIAETSDMINLVCPDVVSIRTLAAGYADPLTAPIRTGTLELAWADAPATPILQPAGTLEELRTLIGSITCETKLVCDHASNFVPQISGVLPHHRDTLLASVDEAEAILKAQRNPAPIRILV